MSRDDTHCIPNRDDVCLDLVQESHISFATLPIQLPAPLIAMLTVVAPNLLEEPFGVVPRDRQRRYTRDVTPFEASCIGIGWVTRSSGVTRIVTDELNGTTLNRVGITGRALRVWEMPVLHGDRAIVPGIGEDEAACNRQVNTIM